VTTPAGSSRATLKRAYESSTRALLNDTTPIHYLPAPPGLTQLSGNQRFPIHNAFTSPAQVPPARPRLKSRFHAGSPHQMVRVLPPTLAISHSPRCRSQSLPPRAASTCATRCKTAPCFYVLKLLSTLLPFPRTIQEVYSIGQVPHLETGLRFHVHPDLALNGGISPYAHQ